MDHSRLREAVERIVRAARGGSPVAQDAELVLRTVAELDPQSSVSVAYWYAIRRVGGP